MAGLDVTLDARATGSCEITHPTLGTVTATEVRRTALIQLANMGATILTATVASSSERSN
jgi:hypothetical protein